MAILVPKRTGRPVKDNDPSRRHLSGRCPQGRSRTRRRPRKRHDLILTLGEPTVLQRISASRRSWWCGCWRAPFAGARRTSRRGLPARTRSSSTLLRARDEELAGRFVQFEKRSPRLGVHLGLRRDCGSTLRPGRRAADGAGQRSWRRSSSKGRSATSRARMSRRTTSTTSPASARSASERVHRRPRHAAAARSASVEFEGPYYDAWPADAHATFFTLSAVHPRTGSSSLRRPEPALGRILRELRDEGVFRRPGDRGGRGALWRRSMSVRGRRRRDFQDERPRRLLVGPDVAAVPDDRREQPAAGTGAAR